MAATAVGAMTLVPLAACSSDDSSTTTESSTSSAAMETTEAMPEPVAEVDDSATASALRSLWTRASPAH